MRPPPLPRALALLYACLVGRWPGYPDSVVPTAPRDHGRLLRPRQVKAGVPKALDTLCGQILAGQRNGCVILGGGSPKNFYLQGQPTLWEVYGIPKGGNDYFIQFTTDQVVWGGLSGATPAEAVSWGKVNPGVLPDTVVTYADSTIAFPLLAEYVVASERNRRARKELYHKRHELVAHLKAEAERSRDAQAAEDHTAASPDIDRHR